MPLGGLFIAYISEPTIRETLWGSLLREGNDVFGEVTVDDGRVDLVAETPSGERWGIEVKNRWRLIEWGDYNNWESKPEETNQDDIRDSELGKLSKQVARYAKTGKFDRVLIATQNPQPLKKAFEANTSVFDPSGEFLEKIDLVDFAGYIRTPVLPRSSVEYLRPQYPRDRPLCDADQSMQIVDLGTHLRDDQPSPLEYPDNEAGIAHACWEAFPVAVREGVIPNPEGTTPYRVDVVGFTGSPTSHTIYKRGPDSAGHIVGVEAKINVSPAITDQLNRYVKSGGLTQLYLAVPDAEADDALKILDEADGAARRVGVISASGPRSEITIHRKPDTLKLEVGGLYVGNGDNQMSEIGWGRAWKLRKQPTPAFDQATGMIKPQF